jgi:Na+:H+ antiporter, NhaA family
MVFTSTSGGPTSPAIRSMSRAAAAAAAEAAARQGRFWDMHELLFHRQKALEDGDPRGYAAQLGLDVAAFDRDRDSIAVADRIRRDVDSGLASGQVAGTPTLFIDGVVHRGGRECVKETAR